MPLYDYQCLKCGQSNEVLSRIGAPVPLCCGGFMTRLYTIDKVVIKWSPPGWVDRIFEIHKAQADRGERLRLPHPKEVGAT